MLQLLGTAIVGQLQKASCSLNHRDLFAIQTVHKLSTQDTICIYDSFSILEATFDRASLAFSTRLHCLFSAELMLCPHHIVQIVA